MIVPGTYPPPVPYQNTALGPLMLGLATGVRDRTLLYFGVDWRGGLSDSYLIVSYFTCTSVNLLLLYLYLAGLVYLVLL